MQDPPTPFIDLATQPLAEDEAAREAARAELMNRLTHSSPPVGGDTVEIATARLQGKATSGQRRGWAIFAAVALLLLVVGLAFRSGFQEYLRLSTVYNPPIWRIKNPKPHHEAWLARLTAGVPAEQRLFLFANCTGAATDETKRWLEECRTQPPEDPGWFEEFYRLATYKGVPPELAAYARRVDPGNGLLVMRESDSLILELSRDGKLGRSGKVPRDASYLKAVALIEEAGKAPRYESHIPARQVERLKLIGPAGDIAGISDCLSFLQTCQSSWPGSAADHEIFPTRASDLQSAGDADGLREWIATGDRLTRRALAMPGGPSTSFYLRESTPKSLRREAAKLHLGAEEALLQRWEDSVRKVRASFTPTGPSIAPHVPCTALPRGYWIATAPPDGLVTMSELEPGLKAEHALADRFTALLLAGAFTLLALLATLEGWRRSRATRGLARGLMPLLRPVDYLWLAGLGVALPLAWHVAWMRLSPFGCRDFNIFLAGCVPFLMRGLSLLLLSSCMLLLTARWRLALRGGFIALSPGVRWLGWGVAVYTALLVPLSGMIRYWPGAKPHELLTASSAWGLPLLWLLWQFFALAFRSREAALGGVVLWRFLLPVLVGASALMLAVMPPLKGEERTWVARDTISGPDPGGTENTVLGARYAKLFRQRLLDAMK